MAIYELDLGCNGVLTINSSADCLLAINNFINKPQFLAYGSDNSTCIDAIKFSSLKSIIIRYVQYW